MTTTKNKMKWADFILENRNKLPCLYYVTKEQYHEYFNSLFFPLKHKLILTNVKENKTGITATFESNSLNCTKVWKFQFKYGKEYDVLYEITDHHSDSFPPTGLAYISFDKNLIDMKVEEMWDLFQKKEEEVELKKRQKEVEELKQKQEEKERLENLIINGEYYKEMYQNLINKRKQLTDAEKIKQFWINHGDIHKLIKSKIRENKIKIIREILMEK